MFIINLLKETTCYYVMRYDYTRLKEFSEENNIILLDDYSSNILNIFTVIQGQCLHP